MPRPQKRSTTWRKVPKKLPGGRRTMQYKRRKPQKAHCAKCKKVLSGVPRGLPYQIKRLAKTERRPDRPYGGVLCTQCTRALFKEKARSVTIDA